MKKIILSLMMCFLINQSVFALEESSGLGESTLKEAKASIQRGVNFLLSKQNTNGSFGPYGGLPPITALCATAIIGNPDYQMSIKHQEAVNKAFAYILQFVQKDGSIYNPKAHGYPNYTTAVTIIALATVRNSKYNTIILNARRFIKNSQMESGGIGYGSDKTKSDMSNTSFALEALYLTEYVENDSVSIAEKEKTKQAWNRALAFINKAQKIDSNKEEWNKKNKNKDDKGGFVYGPTRSKRMDKDGTLRTYGSMTYAGLKSMIYAKLAKNDPRVKAAINWAAKHYTYKENPGLKLKGHFYYLNSMVKSFAAMGNHIFTDSKGVKHFWRKEAINQFLSMQKGDGRWENSDGKWMESMPELATAFNLISMEIAVGKEIK